MGIVPPGLQGIRSQQQTALLQIKEGRTGRRLKQNTCSSWAHRDKLMPSPTQGSCCVDSDLRGHSRATAKGNFMAGHLGVLMYCEPEPDFELNS